MPLKGFLEDLDDKNKKITNLQKLAEEHKISHNYSTVMAVYNFVKKTAKGVFRLKKDYKVVKDDDEFHQILKDINNDITNKR